MAQDFIATKYKGFHTYDPKQKAQSLTDVFPNSSIRSRSVKTEFYNLQYDHVIVYSFWLLVAFNGFLKKLPVMGLRTTKVTKVQAKEKQVYVCFTQ